MGSTLLVRCHRSLLSVHIECLYLDRWCFLICSASLGLNARLVMPIEPTVKVAQILFTLLFLTILVHLVLKLLTVLILALIDYQIDFIFSCPLDWPTSSLDLRLLVRLRPLRYSHLATRLVALTLLLLLTVCLWYAGLGGHFQSWGGRTFPFNDALAGFLIDLKSTRVFACASQHHLRCLLFLFGGRLATNILLELFDSVRIP